MTDMDFEAERQAMRRMKQIDDEVNIDYMLGVQELTDIERVYCVNHNLGYQMRKNIITRFMEQEKTLTKKQKDELLNGENIRVSRSAIIPYFRNELCAHGESIDWDKFLLVSAYRARRMILKGMQVTMTTEKVETYRKIMQTALNLINNKSERIDVDLDFEIGKTKHVQYSYEELLRDLDNDMHQEAIQLDKWKKEISKDVQGTEGR